jgi:hypothetical protein
MRQKTHLSILRDARVIGATTTGAAMKHTLLKTLEVSPLALACSPACVCPGGCFWSQSVRIP